MTIMRSASSAPPVARAPQGVTVVTVRPRVVMAVLVAREETHAHAVTDVMAHQASAVTGVMGHAPPEGVIMQGLRVNAS